MMKKELKLVMGIIILGIIVILSSCNVQAAETIIIGGNNATTNATDTTNTANNGTIIVGGNNAEATTPTVNTTGTYNATANTTTTLPKTGENDVYIIGALGIVCVISAVYAYRKIRNYNI